jgi:hypothetical protein
VFDVPAELLDVIVVVVVDEGVCEELVTVVDVVNLVVDVVLEEVTTAEKMAVIVPGPFIVAFVDGTLEFPKDMEFLPLFELFQEENKYPPAGVARILIEELALYQIEVPATGDIVPPSLGLLEKVT